MGGGAWQAAAHDIGARVDTDDDILVLLLHHCKDTTFFYHRKQNGHE